MADEAGHLVVPPPTVKEALHHLPKDYTAGHDDRVRHRLVGNGWHWGVASHLLSIVVVAASLGQTEAQNPPTGPPPSSTLQWLQTLRGSALWPMEPPPRASTPAVDEAISEEDHWRMAMAARRPRARP